MSKSVFQLKSIEILYYWIFTSEFLVDTGLKNHINIHKGNETNNSVPKFENSFDKQKIPNSKRDFMCFCGQNYQL